MQSGAAAKDSPITIVIADDHQVVRAGLRLLLEAEEGFEVLAEAGDVPTTEPGGRWSLVNGSSYAAAHVSGLVALMRERDPSMARGRTLIASRSGGGTIDACASLMRAAGPCDCGCARTPRLAADTRR